MPNKALSKPRSAKQTAAATVNVYASINADDLKRVDAAAAAAKPRPVSRSMMIATIVNQWAEGQAK